MDRPVPLRHISSVSNGREILNQRVRSVHERFFSNHFQGLRQSTSRDLVRNLHHAIWSATVDPAEQIPTSTAYRDLSFISEASNKGANRHCWNFCQLPRFLAIAIFLSDCAVILPGDASIPREVHEFDRGSSSRLAACEVVQKELQRPAPADPLNYSRLAESVADSSRGPEPDQSFSSFSD